MRNKLKFNHIRLQENARLGKIRDINTLSLKKQFSKSSNQGGTSESEFAYEYDDEQTFAEEEQKVVLETFGCYEQYL